MHNLRTKIHWIEAESLEGRSTDPSKLRQFDGILVPGGFGKRGIPGMIRAIQYAREEKVPYFGICLGMQCAVIEYARNVCGLDRRQQHRVRYRTRRIRSSTNCATCSASIPSAERCGSALIPRI